MLRYYDANRDAFNSNPLHTVHNGLSGGSDVHLILIRNDDASVYYTDLVLQYISSKEDYGLHGSTGWGVKMISGGTEPLPVQWDAATDMTSIHLPDIGDASLGDTFTYHPVWVRFYCPGGSPAMLRESQKLRLYYNELQVTE
jgi:hypothetical protein